MYEQIIIYSSWPCLSVHCLHHTSLKNMILFIFAEMADGHFKSFVSEDTIKENRRKRQEEWEKVRTADQPLEAPEEEYDPRSLFERLEQQKAEVQEKYEEQQRLSNQVKGLDEEEADFLASVSDQQRQIEKKREEEDLELISKVKAATSSQAPMDLKSISSTQKKKTSGVKKENFQKSILVGAVKRKSSDAENVSSPTKKAYTDRNMTESKQDSAGPVMLKPIGILPGLGCYTDSSDDSSCSSDSEVELGPKQVLQINVQVKQGSHSCG